MSSTITRKSKPRKRKPQSGRKPAARRRDPVKSAKTVKKTPAPGFAEWIGVGVETEDLPAWKDLATGKNKRNPAKNVRKQVDTLLDKVTTSQFALFLMVAALGLGLYVSHVFATRDTLSFLEQQRRENLKLELQYNQLRGQLDKKISPSVIYKRAIELGLEEGLSFGPSIAWQLEEKED